MHEIYGSICELECESGFDWSTFLLTAIIFDWLCAQPQGCCALKEKKLQMPGAAQGCVRERLGGWVKIF